MQRIVKTSIATAFLAGFCLFLGACNRGASDAKDNTVAATVNGKKTGTLLLLVLVIVEVTDLVFAVDSIPAIFAITTNTFIVYTSNVFAILGLRSMYFLLAGVVEKFQYLRMGLAIVLTFIGVKMLIEAFHIVIDVRISLIVVAVVLSGSVVASLIWPKEAELKIDVEMPEDFDSPFEEEPESQEDPEGSTVEK